jgi:NAD-dependent deacetylase
MQSSLEAARDQLRTARSVSVLTGAGVSAESGIPTFRSNGGFWRNNRFEDLATPAGFARDPKFVWEWYEERRRGIAATQPNAAHFAIAELERRAPQFTLITQNVDGLHHVAGSKNVNRLHGDIWILRCTKCGFEEENRNPLAHLPPRCECGALLRPGVVWFGELLPEGAIERATAAVLESDLFLVVGTSARVFPAAGLIPLAIQRGATVIEVNPEETNFSAEVTSAVRGPAAEIMPSLL